MRRFGRNSKISAQSRIDKGKVGKTAIQSMASSLNPSEGKKDVEPEQMERGIEAEEKEQKEDDAEKSIVVEEEKESMVQSGDTLGRVIQNKQKVIIVYGGFNGTINYLVIFCSNIILLSY